MATIPTSIEVKLNSEQLQEFLSKIDALEKRIAVLEGCNADVTAGVMTAAMAKQNDLEAWKKFHGVDSCYCGEEITQDSCHKCGSWHDIHGRR